MSLTAISDAVEGFFKGAVKPVLDKFIPDAQQRLEAENMFFRMSHEVNLGQVEINKIEAANTNVFVSGWRPFIGWVCGVTLLYSVLGHAFLVWSLDVVSVFSSTPIPTIPKPDMTITFEILLAMLGLGGFRTYEKVKGVA